MIAFVIDCSIQGSILGPLIVVICVDDLPAVIEKHELANHLYADDTQIVDHLQLSKRLQLNTTKLEIIWFGSRTSLHRLQGVDLSLHIGADIIAPFIVVRDLGVLLDSELSMTSHITKVSSICYYQLRRLKQVRRVLGASITAHLMSTFVISRLDYCNAILAGLP